MTVHAEGDPEKTAVSRVREALAKRLWIRFHMALILGVVVLAGVLGSKLLLLIGLTAISFATPPVIVGALAARVEETGTTWSRAAA